MSPIGHHSTRFIGRQADLIRLRTEFDAGARLITLCGPAGMGKTRLAVQYAAERRHADGGVWFCELENARTTAELVSMIARAIDAPVPLSADETAASTQLGRALMSRGRALFVLDNVEQAIDCCSALVTGWLRSHGEAQFLVTSRERLEIAGENAHELHPLSLPASGAEAAGSEAVQLLLDRAMVVGRSIELSAATADSIAELVRQLDGIPLAIELAAARLDLLGVQDLVERLPRRLQLLQAEQRGRPSRQATLRGALQWSWDLLDDQERTVLAQSSVFRGGFTLEAAEQVVDVDVEVATLLRSLTRKSLLVARHERERLRFGHYESIRVFASEQLAMCGETQATQRRHRDHYLGRSGPWCAAIDRNGSPAAQLSLAREMENLLAIYERCLGEGDSVSTLSAALAVDPTYASRGPLATHLEVLSRAIAVCADDVAPALAARAFRARGNALRVRGRLDDALPDLNRALRDAPATLEAAVLADLGVLHHQRRSMGEAATLYDRALSRARATGQRRTEARALGNLAALAHDEERLADAEVDYRRALAVFADIGDRRHEGIFLANLAVLERELGRGADAGTHFRRSLELLEGVGDRRLVGITLANLGAHEHVQGNLEEAKICLSRALELLRAMGELRSEALCLGRLGAVIAALDDVDTALAHIDGAERLLERIGDEVALAAVTLARAFIDIAEAARARIGNEPARADQLLSAVRARIAEARAGSPPLVQRSDDARSFIRTIDASLARLDPPNPRTPQPALEVGPEARWFRPPDGEPQDLNRRKALRLILLHLTEQRRKAPGHGVTVSALQAAGWPGEKIRADAGANRVYVSLNKLRNMGLEGILVRSEEGYLLDPSMRVERVTTDWRAMRD